MTVAGAAATVAYQLMGDRDYRTLLARGDTALRSDQTFPAIEAYSGAVALRPDSMLPRLRRGEAYQHRGDLDAAVRDFRDAAALDLAATRPREELGDVLYQLERYQRAVEAYETALALDDRLARVDYKLAIARYRAGDARGAITALAPRGRAGIRRHRRDALSAGLARATRTVRPTRNGRLRRPSRRRRA